MSELSSLSTYVDGGRYLGSWFSGGNPLVGGWFLSVWFLAKAMNSSSGMSVVDTVCMVCSV
jgi:hypothetical protein